MENKTAVRQKAPASGEEERESFVLNATDLATVEHIRRRVHALQHSLLHETNNLLDEIERLLSAKVKP